MSVPSFEINAAARARAKLRLQAVGAYFELYEGAKQLGTHGAARRCQRRAQQAAAPLDILWPSLRCRGANGLAQINRDEARD